MDVGKEIDALHIAPPVQVETKFYLDKVLHCGQLDFPGERAGEGRRGRNLYN